MRCCVAISAFSDTILARIGRDTRQITPLIFDKPRTTAARSPHITFHCCFCHPIHPRSISQKVCAPIRQIDDTARCNPQSPRANTPSPAPISPALHLYGHMRPIQRPERLWEGRNARIRTPARARSDNEALARASSRCLSWRPRLHTFLSIWLLASHALTDSLRLATTTPVPAAYPCVSRETSDRLNLKFASDRIGRSAPHSRRRRRRRSS